MKLTSGRVTIPIQRDGIPTGELTFDPQDVGFVQQFYELVEGLEQREQAHKQLAEASPREQLGEMVQLCSWLREQLDRVFGEGCAQMLFGSLSSPDLFRQFFEGVEPYIRAARGKKLDSYRGGKKLAVME